MPNLRLLFDNAIDRATLTASSTAGALVAANLQTDVKSDVWRATSTTARLTGIFNAAEAVQAIVLPMCNLSPTAMMRARVTSEAAATNLLTAPNDFSNAAWTRTNLNLATGVAGPDGANSASTLTATAGSAEIRQTRTVTAGAYSSSVFVRRRTGSGAVSIRNVANTAWTSLPLTTSWMRALNDGGATGTSAVLAIQIATSGDAIDICFAQMEAGAASSYYPGTRPLGYIDSWQSYTFDSGSVLACPAPALLPRGWSAAQAASAYAYGGGACARIWMPVEIQARGISIDIVDTNNLQGYIEAARLVVGPYWSPTYNASDASWTPVDSTATYRTDAGGQVADAGFIYDQVSIDMSMMPSADRTVCARFLRNSRAYPIFLSLFPESTDLELERDHSIYGRRTQDSEMSIQNSIFYGTKIPIEEI